MTLSEQQQHEVATLLTTLIDCTPNAGVYVCGHFHGTVSLVAGAIPAVVVWGHTALEPISPRVLDMQTAAEYRRLCGSPGVKRTEKYSGSHADWRVIPHEIEGSEDGETR